MDCVYWNDPFRRRREPHTEADGQHVAFCVIDSWAFPQRAKTTLFAYLPIQTPGSGLGWRHE